MEEEKRLWVPSQKERSLVGRYRDLSIEVDVAEGQLKKLKEERKALGARIVELFTARGMRSASFPEIGTVRVEARTHWRVADPQAFDEWWRARALPWETFHALNGSKVSSFCKAQEALPDGELPKGVDSYDEERVVLRKE